MVCLSRPSMQLTQTANGKSETVLSTVNLGPPTCMVDRTIFEMWLGAL